MRKITKICITILAAIVLTGCNGQYEVPLYTALDKHLVEEEILKEVFEEISEENFEEEAFELEFLDPNVKKVLGQLGWEYDAELEITQRDGGLYVTRQLDDHGGIASLTLEYVGGDFIATREWWWQQETNAGAGIVQISTNVNRNLISDTERVFYFISVDEDEELDVFAFTLAQDIAGGTFYFQFVGERLENKGGIGDFVTHMMSIEITDSSGLVQRIEEVEIGVWGSISTSFEDLNFDGYLDMVIHKHPGGNRWAGAEHYWLWDAATRQFVYNAQLSELSADGLNVDANPNTQQVEAWVSSAAGRSYTFYDWDGDELVAVSTLMWVHQHAMHWAWDDPDIDFPEEYTTVLVRRDLISGEEEMWFEYWP